MKSIQLYVWMKHRDNKTKQKHWTRIVLLDEAKTASRMHILFILISTSVPQSNAFLLRSRKVQFCQRVKNSKKANSNLSYPNVFRIDSCLLLLLAYPFTYGMRLCCFQALSVINRSPINIVLKVFVWTYISIPLSKYQRHIIPRHCVSFIQYYQISFKEDLGCCIPQEMNESPFCSRDLPMIRNIDLDIQILRFYNPSPKPKVGKTGVNDDQVKILWDKNVRNARQIWILKLDVVATSATPALEGWSIGDWGWPRLWYKKKYPEWASLVSRMTVVHRTSCKSIKWWELENWPWKNTHFGKSCY